MAFLLVLATLSASESSFSLPDPLRNLSKTADAFGASIAKLDKETNAVVADAALVHKVSSNRTTRGAVVEYMSDQLKAGMPSGRPCEEAEEAAGKAATAYAKATVESKAARAQLAILRERMAKGNATAKEDAELQRLRNASLSADEKRAETKAEFERKLKSADEESAALLEATRKYVNKFTEHIDELMRSARSRETAAEHAISAATNDGQAAAQAAMKSRKLDERAGERDELKTERWAESHEEAIEVASDRASDDLERIYAPVKLLARKTLDAAEHEAEQRRSRLHRLLDGDKGVELAEEHHDDTGDVKKAPPDVPAWVPWAAGLALAVLHPLLKYCCCCKHGSAAKKAVAGSALLAGALQQPLLAEERI